MNIAEGLHAGKWLSKAMFEVSPDISLQGCIKKAKADNVPIAFAAILHEICKAINARNQEANK